MYRLLIIVFAFTSCRNNTPDYNNDVLQGSWLRYESTDAREDSMIVNIKGDTAFIQFSSNQSDFTIGTMKWISITPVARDAQNDQGDFTLLDLSGSGSYYNATIFVQSDSTFTLNSLDFPSAPGGKQSWKRY